MLFNCRLYKTLSLRRCCLLALAGLCGCAAPSKSNPDSPAPAPSARTSRSGAGQVSRSGRPAASTKPSTVDAAEVPFGHVVTANLLLKFVVLDFSLRPLPVIGQTLQLYRNGQRVGELRVSGPELDGHIVADITAGDAASGDEARLD